MPSRKTAFKITVRHSIGISIGILFDVPIAMILSQALYRMAQHRFGPSLKHQAKFYKIIGNLHLDFNLIIVHLQPS
jgi:hypothetical protein